LLGLYEMRQFERICNAKRYDSIGSDSARRRADERRGRSAESLSIEPFERSRWRLRRTRRMTMGVES
jgi:hypothetical protein